MAVLYITEFVSQGVDLNGRQLPVAALPINSNQTLAVGGSSASSSSLQNNTQLVRLHTDTTCSVNVSTVTSATGAVTATTTNFRMAANQTEYFNVPNNNSYKVACISNS